MFDANKAIVRRFIEELDKGNLEGAMEFIETDFVFHGPNGPLDRQGFKQVASVVYAAFSDLSHTIEDQIAEGDRVVTRGTMGGTHQGEFQGIAATQKRMMMTEISIDRLSGGKIIEHRVVADALGMMQQLGAIP